MKEKITVGLVSHLFEDYNLGCAALSISNVKLMDEVFEKQNKEVHYVVLITESFPQAPLDKYTKNSYEYRYYPRFRQTVKHPAKLFKSKIFDDCSIIINLCGGDGYTDIYGFARLMAESQVAYAASQKHIPVIFAPQTIGPFNRTISKKVANATLGRVKKVFVRDASSMECCKKLGIDDHTQQVIDVAFALPFVRQENTSGKMKIGLNVSGLLYNGGYNYKNYFGLSFDYKEFTENLIAKLCDETDAEIHLIPHVNSETNEVDDDYRVCKSLSQKFRAVVLAPRFTSPIDAKNYISGMDLFSGARMHATIGAFSSGVPVIPIAYSRKFNGLYKTLEYPYIIDAKSSITKEQAIAQFFEYMKQVKKLKEAVDNGKTIYINGLEQYKLHLGNVIEECLK